MKILDTKLKLEKFNNKLLDQYLGKLSYASFDIETTGLNPKYSKIILAGLLFYSDEDKCFISRQILAENQSEEKELLLELKKQLESFDYVLTFNGKHFDLAFIEERYKKYKILFRPPLYNLDLYLFVNGFSDLRSHLPNLKQKTVEMYMGLSEKREDEISGKESIILYNEYEATKDPILEKVILLHNSDDILQLYKLQEVLKQTDIHKAFSKLGFPVISKDFGPIQISDIKVRSKEIEVSGIQYAHEACDYIKFDDADSTITMSLDSATREFNMSIPITRKYGGAYVTLSEIGLNIEDFKDYGNYVNGYVVVQNKNEVNSLEINMIIKKILE